MRASQSLSRCTLATARHGYYWADWALALKSFFIYEQVLSARGCFLSTKRSRILSKVLFLARTRAKSVVKGLKLYSEYWPPSMFIDARI